MVVNYADARAVVEAIALVTGSYSCLKMYNSIEETADETLITELARRGYDLSGLLRENAERETTAEIVQIGKIG